MKRLLPLLLILIASIVKPQDIPIITFKEFEPRLKPTDDTVYVINFWATWCKPCVDEMPEFIKLHEAFKDRNFKLTLASLDFRSQYEKKLIPFVNANNIKSEVLLLNAPNYNDWINKVSKKWGGSIPATVIIHKPSRTYLFYERQMNFEEMKSVITPLLN
jgi:thiol-disulfide isomerase/thioredoxin